MKYLKTLIPKLLCNIYQVIILQSNNFHEKAVNMVTSHRNQRLNSANKSYLSFEISSFPASYSVSYIVIIKQPNNNIFRVTVHLAKSIFMKFLNVFFTFEHCYGAILYFARNQVGTHIMIFRNKMFRNHPSYMYTLDYYIALIWYDSIWPGYPRAMFFHLQLG